MWRLSCEHLLDVGATDALFARGSVWNPDDTKQASGNCRWQGMEPTVRSRQGSGAPVPGLLGVGWASALMLWEQSSWLDFPWNLTEGSCSL